MQSNRAIVLTPPGSSAITVVRIVGPGVGAFLRQHFSKQTKAGRCVHGVLSDGARVIDDPVVVLLPNSGGADINLHGGPWVVRSVLDLAARDGFEIESPLVCSLPYSGEGVRVRGDSAELSRSQDWPLTPALSPGYRGEGAKPDASLAAVDGETIIEREIAATIPAARTELGLRVLLNQVDAWRRFKADSPTPDKIREVLADASLRHLLDPPTVAIIGAANVGKSTLANQLFGQERSITANVPGTTRDWVGEIANIDGLPVMLVDTPGMRTTDDLIERAAIEQSQSRIGQAACIILVLDATRPFRAEQLPLAESYPNAICVVNKCDQMHAWNWHDDDAIETVATAGIGLDKLRRAIADRFGCATVDVDLPRWWTNRQKILLEAAIGEPAILNEI